MGNSEFLRLITITDLALGMALLGLHYMAGERFRGLPGEALLILYSSMSIMLLIVIPIPFGIKLIGALAMSYVVSILSRAERQQGTKMFWIWLGYLIYVLVSFSMFLK